MTDWKLLNSRMLYLELDLVISGWFVELNNIAEKLISFNVQDLNIKLKLVVLFYIDYLIDLYHEISKFLLIRFILCFDK